MADKITIKYLIYPRDWEVGEDPEVVDSFSEALRRAVEYGTDTCVVVDVRVDKENGDASLFSPYELYINVRDTDYSDKVNEMVFGSMTKGE